MTDPVTVARRVVDEYERMDDWNKPRTRSGKEVPPSRVTLARAVIDLTAQLDAERFAHANTAVKVKNVEALADRLDAEAADDFDGVSGTSVSLVKYETAKAIRAAITTALEGETP